MGMGSTKYLRYFAVASVSAVALWAPGAAAQAAAEAEAASQGEGAGTLQDIVVTAQRRSENLQNVPVAVTAANAAALSAARVDNIVNVAAISPSIQFRASNNAASSGNIQIRGIGTSGQSRSFEGAVGVFIDGVYRTRSGQALQNFLDVDSLQILRGPQGTLFGKNTSAGAVLVTSAAPETDAFHGYGQFDYGNYDTQIAKGAVSGPLSDTLAFRIAGLYSHRDGFYHDPNNGRHYNGDETYATKGQLLFEPSSTVRVRVIGDYSISNGHCCYGTTDAIAGPTQPLIDALTRANGLTSPSRDPQDFEAVLNDNGNQRIKDYGATVLADVDMGDDRLSSVSAYRRYSLAQTGMDADFSGADIFGLDESFRSEFMSQELTYNGKVRGGISADYVVGAFFSDENIGAIRSLYWGTQAQTFWNAALAQRGLPAGTASAPPGLFTTEDMLAHGRSYAVFTHWDFKVGENFNIIAGLRYTRERKQGAFFNSFYTTRPTDPFRLLGLQRGPAYDQSTTNNALSGTLGLQYRPADHAMLYLTYNRGFKAGGINIDSNAAGIRGNNPAEVAGAVPGDPSFRPEKIDAFEAGGKFDLFDRRARLNIAAFYSRLSDLQVAQFVGLQFKVLNARRATVYGGEVEADVKLADAVTLNIAGTWLPKADYAADAVLGAPLSGRRFANTPKFAGNIGVSLDQPIGGTLAVVGRLQAQYATKQFTYTATNAVQGAVTLINANLGLKSSAGWKIEGWIQNLTNKTYYTRHFPPPLQSGDQNAYLGAPRTFGVSARIDF